MFTIVQWEIKQQINNIILNFIEETINSVQSWVSY